MNGFVLIDKPSEWTSRDVCNKLRHLLHVDKTGHTGTLDPFATGLLIVSVNKATKAGIYIEEDEKEYIAELELGKKTSTGDVTGEVILEKNPSILKVEDIKKILSSFVGEQEQIPPMTSAIHYQGVKLYELAHQGVEVERKPRKIDIKSIELVDFSSNTITFKCLVSKGTYIRALAEDIASKLGEVGYLKSLRRLSIGAFKIEDAKKMEDVKENNIIETRYILKKYLREYQLDEKQSKRAYNGASLILPCSEKELLLISSDNVAIAIYEKDNEKYICKRGLW